MGDVLLPTVGTDAILSQFRAVCQLAMNRQNCEESMPPLPGWGCRPFSAGSARWLTQGLVLALTPN